MSRFTHFTNESHDEDLLFSIHDEHDVFKFQCYCASHRVALK